MKYTKPKYKVGDTIIYKMYCNESEKDEYFQLEIMQASTMNGNWNYLLRFHEQKDAYEWVIESQIIDK